MLRLLFRGLLRVSRMLDFRGKRYLRRLESRRYLRSVCLDGLSYYPGEPRKTEKQIRQELFALMSEDRGSWSDEMTLTQYFQFGCDRASADVDSFVFQKEFDRARDSLNGRLAPLFDYKNVAGVYLNACGVKASCAIGQMSQDGQQICLRDGSGREFVAWLREYAAPVFCKPNDGCQGKSCYRVEWREEEASLYLNGERQAVQDALRVIAGHIVEPLIVQHQDMRRYSPNCANPLRIRTLCVGGEIRYISTYICIAPADAYFSNVVRCGVAVGLDETGRCITDGFCEMPGKEGRSQLVPGTDIRLDEIVIPGVKEAIELAKAAHRTTPQIFAMGWDVAVTDEGPIIIEGNPRFGSCTYQAISGMGERMYFEQEFKSRLHN